MASKPSIVAMENNGNGIDYRNGSGVFPSADVSDSVDALWEIYPGLSKGFALATARLRESAPYEADVLMIDYSIVRTLDCLEDFSLERSCRENRKKNALGNLFLDALESGRIDSASWIESLLEDVRVDRESYRKLLETTPHLVRAFNGVLPASSRQNVIRYSREMVGKMFDPDFQRIETLDDQIEYCKCVAGNPGYMITDFLEERGHFSHLASDMRHEMRGLARDFALAYQLTNNIQDIREDIVHGRPRWASQLLEKHGVKRYQDILDVKNKDKVGAVLDEQRGIARGYYDEAIDYVDNMPFSPKGLRIYCGNALAWSAAVLRRTQNPEMFYSNKPITITERETMAVDKKICEFAETGASVRGFIEHLLDKPAHLYK